MTWDTFLNHPAVVTYHRQANPGQYLFRKTIHEIVVGCFTFQEWGRFLDHIATMTTATAADMQAVQLINASLVRHWYTTWLPHISRWRTDLLALQARYGEHSESGTINWPTQISALADVIDEITNIHQEAQTLVLPQHERAREFFHWLQDSVDRIQMIHHAIREHDYIRIYDYPDTGELER
jgi:hypothetical protein